jgi:hypothetical protein
MGYLYLDTNALDYAYRAGGLPLLDKYAALAKLKGYTLAVTDVVVDEIGHGGEINVRTQALQEWLRANATELHTQERGRLEAFRARRLADYDMFNRGDRSIIERLISDPEAHKSAIFSDDRGFRNPDVWQRWIAEGRIAAQDARAIKFDIGRVVCTNPDMLAAATEARVIYPQQYDRICRSFRENVSVYRQGSDDYSRALDERFLSEAEVTRLRAGQPARGVKILGAFGRLARVAGPAFIAIDTMATAAEAATQLQEGDQAGAARTVAEFGGRAAGAWIGMEQGAALGAILGSVAPGPGTLIGAVAGGAFGGVVGATLGEHVAGDLWTGITRGFAPPTVSRLVDDRVRSYDNTEIQELQKDLYGSGYSNAQVNYVCTSVEARLLGLHPDEARVGDVLTDLAGSIPAPVTEAIDGHDATGALTADGDPGKGGASDGDGRGSPDPDAQAVDAPDEEPGAFTSVSVVVRDPDSDRVLGASQDVTGDGDGMTDVAEASPAPPAEGMGGHDAPGALAADRDPGESDASDGIERGSPGPGAQPVGEPDEEPGFSTSVSVVVRDPDSDQVLGASQDGDGDATAPDRESTIFNPGDPGGAVAPVESTAGPAPSQDWGYPPAEPTGAVTPDGPLVPLPASSPGAPIDLQHAEPAPPGAGNGFDTATAPPVEDLFSDEQVAGEILAPAAPPAEPPLVVEAGTGSEPAPISTSEPPIDWHHGDPPPAATAEGSA